MSSYMEAHRSPFPRRFKTIRPVVRCWRRYDATVGYTADMVDEIQITARG